MYNKKCPFCGVVSSVKNIKEDIDFLCPEYKDEQK